MKIIFFENVDNLILISKMQKKKKKKKNQEMFSLSYIIAPELVVLNCLC